MIEIAENVYQIPLLPRNAINAYLIGSVLIDSGIGWSGKRILAAVDGRYITAHALTHAHPDHLGSSAVICNQLEVPLWCGEADRALAERDTGMPAARVLGNGDIVEGFQVLETPGHTPGHIAFWRESDRVLIAGDVVLNMNLLTTVSGLGEPLKRFTADVEENRRSIKRIAVLAPNVMGVGHGPPVYGPEDLLALASRC